MTRLLALALGAVAAVSGAAAQQTVGLFVNDSPQPGLTLVSPIPSTTTYLLHHDGLLVRSWESTLTPGNMSYLLENGDLLLSVRLEQGVDMRWLTAPGNGGGLEQYDWDGNLVWQFQYTSATHHPHHDIEPLPNGNVLLLVWDVVFEPEAVAAGMNPAFVNGEVWIDRIIEVEPTPPSGGNIVWQWHGKDHLIQDFDATKANFGVVIDHPELIDVNFTGPQLDWSHLNSIDYNPALDQIVVSSHSYNEIWVIDHSTTTAEAASHGGGNSGRGGDLLYRWGNAASYDRVGPGEQRLYGQHDAQWIAPGRPGAGNILIFNNGLDRPGIDYSTVEEIVPPIDMNGAYTIGAGVAYGPTAPIWTYAASPPTSWFSAGRSGAERQANGNTLICQTVGGRFFEVAPDGTIVWEYVNPVRDNGAVAQGSPAVGNGVFKVRRYGVDFPGFAGRDLTPGDPVELFERPHPVPADSLLAARAAVDGTAIDLQWDGLACPSFDYNLLSGSLQDVASWTIAAAECAIGTDGFHAWSGVPAGDLFFLIVGTDETGIYESGWGNAADGEHRFGTKASFYCGTTTKVVSSICP